MTQRERLSLILGNSIRTKAGYILETSCFTSTIKLSKHLDKNGHFTPYLV